MTHVKAWEEKTPDRSSSIFAGFSNPRASTNRNSEGQELHLYFEQKSPVQPILLINKSSCNFKQKAIWQLAPENQCSKETVTARRGWTPVTRFKFHAKGTPDGPEICIIMQYWHPWRKVILFLLLLVWVIKTSSSIYLKFSAICRGNSRIFGVRKNLNFRPIRCALGMKFESCDWCPALLRAVTVSLLHWFLGVSCQMAFCLKLQLDLFIERIGCTGNFRSKYKCSSCPSLLQFVEARGLEKPAKIDDDRSGVFSSQALTRVMIPSLSSFLFFLPPTP